jgi:hypothetical protein
MISASENVEIRIFEELPKESIPVKYGGELKAMPDSWMVDFEKAALQVWN